MTASPPTSESAIVIPVELPVAVRRLRDGLDWSAKLGVPPHVTLLYPFMPPAALNEDVRDRIATIVAGEPVFAFSLAQMRRWPTVVWLAPEPDEPFRRLTAALHAEFPDYPPYGGMHDEVIPHLTIVEDPRPDWLAAAERALPAMLPIRDVAREAHVLVQSAGDQGRWQRVWRLPLAGA